MEPFLGRRLPDDAIAQQGAGDFRQCAQRLHGANCTPLGKEADGRVDDDDGENRYCLGHVAHEEGQTAGNEQLDLVIAANYGGQWDITQACRSLAQRVADAELAVQDISPEAIAGALSTPDLPMPDLFIRTGGEHRISNFLLWQLAYTELYFTDLLWPEFDAGELDTALRWYANRQRRFGRTGDQVEQLKGA